MTNQNGKESHGRRRTNHGTSAQTAGDISDKPKLSKATRPSQAAYRHGRQDGARQAIGLKETGQAGNWTLEK